MQRFLRSAALLVLTLLILSHLIDYMVTSGLRKTELPQFAVWNAILSEETSSDVIIQGSSRAWVGVSPAIISDRLDLTCYNLGVNGYSLDMQLARYRLYREHQPAPKLVVQVLDAYSFNMRPDLYDNNQFLPYLSEAPVREAVEPYGYYRWYDYDLPLVRYRGKVELIWRGIAELLGIRHYVNQMDRGYLGQERKWTDEFDKFAQEHPDGYEQVWRQSMVDDLDAFLAECTGDGIMVVMVYMPEYYGARDLLNNREEIFTIFRRLSEKHDVAFLDYSFDPMAGDTEYFYNSQHLNKLGAERFSAQLAEDLATLLQGGSPVAVRPQ